MKTNTWNWTTTDGLEMLARDWEPERKPGAVVCLVHGLGEHCGRYAHVGAALAGGGFVLSGFDLRGHGRSGGPRGHFPSLGRIMEDIHEYIDLAREKFGDLPVFLYGHSLGGLLVLTYATYRSHALSGVIATGAGLRSPVLEQKGKMALAEVLGGFLPNLTIPSGLDANAISRDPEVVRAYRQDPLVHAVATLAAARAGIAAVDWAFTHAGEFPVPLLLMHGSADHLDYPRGSQEFAGLVPADCTLKLWEGLSHEIHNEPEQAEVLDYMLAWLKARLKKK